MENNSVWLIEQNDSIFVRTWHGQYKIEQKMIVNQIKEIIPEIKNQPILLGENDNVSDRYADKWNQIKIRIVGMAHNYENNKQTKTMETNSNVYIFKGKSRKELITDVVEYEKESFCLIFSVKLGCVVAKGNKVELIQKVNMFQEEDFKCDIDKRLLEIALVKTNKSGGEVNNWNNIFYIVTNEDISIQEKYEIVDIHEDKKERKSIQDWIIPESKNIHLELSELNQIIKKMSFYILNWSFEKLNQIPFKIAEFIYIKENVQIEYYSAGEDPGEVFIRSFKMGMAHMLNKSLEKKYAKWVAVQDKADLLISGAVPIIFDYINDRAIQSIEMEEVSMNSIDNIITVLLKQVDIQIDLKDIKISIQYIRGTELKKGNLLYANSKSVMIECYGLDREVVLNTLLIDFYTIFVQNNLSDELGDILLENGNSNLLQGKKRDSDCKVIEQELEKVYTMIGNKSLKVSSWKYNDFFKKSNISFLLTELV